MPISVSLPLKKLVMPLSETGLKDGCVTVFDLTAGKPNIQEKKSCSCLEHNRMAFIQSSSLKNSLINVSINNFLNRFCLILIRFYQVAFSRFFGGQCRFYPSCSHYALECYTKLDFFAASKYTIIRLSKCHPLSFKSGYDPVPNQHSSTHS